MVFPGVGDNWARKATHKNRILSRNFICESSRLDMTEDENIQAADNEEKQQGVVLSRDANKRINEVDEEVSINCKK